MVQVLRTLALCLLAAAIAACGTKDRDPGPNTNPNPNTNPDTTVKLTAISIDAATLSVAIGRQITLTAEGQYDDMTTKDLTAEVTWTSADTTLLAPVDGEAGKFQALAEGRAMVTATLGDVSRSLDITVTPPVLTELAVIPDAGDIGMGGALVVTVIATFSNGQRETVTDVATWATDRPTVLRASATDHGRLVTFGTEGTAVITATYEGMSASGTYVVGPARLEYLVIGGAVARIGDTPVQFSATGYWTDERGATDETTNVTWTSSDPGIVSIDASGLATRVSDGEVVITAEAPSGDLSAQALLKTIGASVCGDYPTDHSTGIAYNAVAAPMFWLDAITQTGELVDFRMEDLPCDTQNYQTALFVVGAGWCPYCPDFKRRIDGMQAQLDAAGMRVIYVEIETDGGSPANNMQANQIIERTLPGTTNSSIRIGDADASGGINQPFGRAVTYLPNALVVRTSDMQVIAAGQNHDFLQIANDPTRQYGSN